MFAFHQKNINFNQQFENDTSILHFVDFLKKYCTTRT